jgi:NAD(P)-dependent dehydrogenase (short-subunit alcohol dehydrogenase family)
MLDCRKKGQAKQNLIFKRPLKNHEGELQVQEDFSGNVIFISGAARGLGRRAAELLGEMGAKLIISDLDEQQLETALAELHAQGIQASGLAGDIAEELTSIQLTEFIGRQHGGLDIAINNAGIVQPQQRLHTIDSKLAEKVLAVDLLGVFYAMKHQIPLMLERVESTGRQCTILNVASAAGLMGSPMLSAYSAAKHGVVGLTRSAAIEYGRKGIRVNCICPAFTRTQMVLKPLEESPHGHAEAETRMVANNPMQRLGEVDEVVQAMIWAISSGNSFFNGHALPVDGGLNA